MQLAGTAGAWTDVSEDVLRPDNISVSYGIREQSPLARTASTGTMFFSLDNSEINSAGLIGYYSPGHINCRTGFKVGITVRLSIEYDGKTHPKFYGRIPEKGIRITTGTSGTKKVYVEVRDFMEQCSITDIETPDFVENKTSAEIQELVIANQDIKPLATQYNTCEETFSTGFDTVKSTTKSIVEMNKANLAELGYSYVKHDINNYEIFTVDGRMTRTNTPSTTTVPMPTETTGYVLQENGFKIILENGLGFIKLNAGTPISFEDIALPGEIQNGNNLYNYIQGIAYPRQVGTVAEVLFKTNTALPINAGETVPLKGTYTDPLNQTNSISAKAMLPPGTADYWMNSNRDKTGADLTANFNIGTPLFYANNVIYSVTNTGTANAYAYVQAQGTAVRVYDPVISFVSDATSIATHGKHTLNLDMKLQDDPTVATAFITTMLSQYKDPVTRAEVLPYCANRSPELLAAFLYLDIGARFTAVEYVSGISGDYFINGVDFTILPGDIINFSWHVKSSAYDTFAFWYVGVAGQSEVGVTTFVGF
jgi:hypothetical protein